MDFNHDIDDGIAYYNDDSEIVVEVRGGVYRVLYDNLEIASGLDNMDAELWADNEVIIGPDGIRYNSGSMPNSNRLHVVFPQPPLILYKATNSEAISGVPGFMASSYAEIKPYLPGGRRHRHYGGSRAVKTTITRVETVRTAEMVDSANFGSILVLPGTPAVFDLGESDGMVVLQEVTFRPVVLRGRRD